MRIVEKARVISVEGGRAKVVMAAEEGPDRCGGCAMASRCRTNERVFTVEIGEGARAGDDVTVEMDVPSPAFAALLLFMLPLLAAFLAGGVAYGLTASEALGVLGGGAGAGAVYLGVWLSGAGSKGAPPRVKPSGRRSSSDASAADT